MKDEINEILNDFIVGNYTQEQSLEAILIVITKYQAKQLGATGGQATVKKYGKSHFSEAGKKGMAKRWGKEIVEKSKT